MRVSLFSFVAVCAALAVSTTTATECQLTSTTEILKKIDLTPSVPKCGSASGFSLNPPPGKPSVAQLDRICALETCRSAINSIAAMHLPSCTISMLNGINLHEIVNTISAYCSNKKQSTTTTTTAVSAATTTGKDPVLAVHPKASVSPLKSQGTENELRPSPFVTTSDALPPVVSGATKRKPNVRKNCHA